MDNVEFFNLKDKIYEEYECSDHIRLKSLFKMCLREGRIPNIHCPNAVWTKYKPGPGSKICCAKCNRRTTWTCGTCKEGNTITLRRKSAYWCSEGSKTYRYQ